MDQQPAHRSRHSAFRMVAAIAWATAFLIGFYRLQLPNNSTADAPLSRLDIWQMIFDQWPVLLNPLDYDMQGTGSAGWQHLSERIPFVKTAVVLWLTCWVIGAALCRLVLGDQSQTRPEKLVLAFSVGISAFTIWVLLCGLSGQLTRAAILSPASVAVVGLIISEWRRHLRTRSSRLTIEEAGQPTASGRRRNALLPVALMLISLPFVLHILLGAMTPPFDFDVREYHLQGPREWLEQGRITHLKHNVYTSFPFLSEMLPLAAMVIDGNASAGAISGKLTLSCFQLLSALSVYALVRREIGTTAGLVSTVAYLSTPWTIRISIIAYAEGALAFYLITSAMLAFRAATANRASDRHRLTSVCGFLAGSAMSAKYTGLVFVVVPIGSFLLFQRWRKTIVGAEETTTIAKDSVFRCGTFFALGVVLATGPWLLKNAVYEGNPVYPLAYKLFGASDWSTEMDARWQAAHSTPEHRLTAVPAHLLDAMARNDWQNGFLFAMAIPAMLFLRRSFTIRWMSWYVVWILFFWWAVTHRIDRFWVPVIPAVCVLAGTAWELDPRKLWKGFVLTMLAVCCTFNYGLSRTSVIGFHAGLMEIKEARRLTIRQDIRLLNQSLPETARVLMVGEAEVLDAEFQLIYNTVFDDNIFEQWTCAPGQLTIPADDREMKSSTEIRNILDRERVTHIYVNWSEILRYRLTYGFTDYVHPQRFQHLVDIGILHPPVTLRQGNWSSRSEQEQTEVNSWHDGPSLQLNHHTWASIQLYRVNRD